MLINKSKKKDKTIDYRNTGFETIDYARLQHNLRRVFSEPMIKLQKLPYGKVNKNLKIIVGKKKFFLKIAPLWYINSLSREAWALTKLGGVGVTVPKVYKLYNKRNCILPGHELLFLHYIEGALLKKKRRLNYASQIITLYNRVHSVKMKGFGWLAKSLTGENSSWLEFLHKIENIESLRSLGNTWPENVLFVQDLVKKFCRNIPSGRLLYGDFNHTNFIIDRKGRVFSLDFQNCFSGDPLYDAGIILAKDQGFRKYLRHIKSSTRINQERQEQLIILYALRHLLSTLSFYVQTNNPKRVRYVERRFTELKKLLEKGFRP